MGNTTERHYRAGYQQALQDVFGAYLDGGADVENGGPAAIKWIADNLNPNVLRNMIETHKG